MKILVERDGIWYNTPTYTVDRKLTEIKIKVSELEEILPFNEIDKQIELAYQRGFKAPQETEIT